MSFFSELGLTNKKTDNESLQQGSIFKDNKASYKSISKISNVSIKEGVDSGDNGESNGSIEDINNSVRVFNEQLRLYEVKMNEYERKQQEYSRLLNKVIEDNDVEESDYEIPQDIRRLKDELNNLNSELIDLTNQMKEQITIIAELDVSLSQHLETQKHEVNQVARNLQTDRMNLERNNDKEINTINGLYNDSELKETGVNYEYMAWILGSITVVGISIYQIKRFS